MKGLQINPANWEDLARDRPTWRRTVKTGSAIYEANRTTAAKANREARKSQLRLPRNANAQPPSTSHDGSGRSGRQSANFSIWITSAAISPSNSASSSTPTTNTDHTPEFPPPPPPPSSSSLPPSPPSSSSSSPALTFAAPAPVLTTTAQIPEKLTSFNLPTVNASDVDTVHTCPHRDRNLTSHISLAGHLRIHRTETGEPVPGEPAYTRRICLKFPHCTRTFTHRIDLLGPMRIHENLR
ncbi:hypothetical protein SprV_0200671400 [Sparganum proliferum]